MSIRLADYADSTIFGLIDEVQKYDIIYDKRRQRTSSDAATRLEIWKGISTILGFPADECQLLWTRIRGSFIRYFKAYQISKDSDKPYNPNNWKFFDSLLFLIPFVASIAPEPSETNPSTASKSTGQFTAVTVAKKAVKRSKNILLKADGELRGTFDVAKFINLVKERPIVYVYQEIRKKENFKKIQEAWAAIADEIGFPECVCSRRWQSLRHNYRCSVRKGKYWKWSSHMEFYQPNFRNMTHLEDDGENVEQSAEMLNGDSNFLHPKIEESNGMEISATPLKSHDTAYSDDLAVHYNGTLSDLSSNLIQGREDTLDLPTHPTTAELDIDSASMQTGLQDDSSSHMAKYSEFHFGMCVAQMLEDIPKPARTPLKAKILTALVSSM